MSSSLGIGARRARVDLRGSPRSACGSGSATRRGRDPEASGCDTSANSTTKVAAAASAAFFLSPRGFFFLAGLGLGLGPFAQALPFPLDFFVASSSGAALSSSSCANTSASSVSPSPSSGTNSTTYSTASAAAASLLRLRLDVGASGDLEDRRHIRAGVDAFGELEWAKTVITLRQKCARTVESKCNLAATTLSSVISSGKQTRIWAFGRVP
ncbi:hypothetical protein MKEN_01485900 [Mycena kentingensis (nom. inval.)]|nr:hypothetical protein MKEN_01485900 [Mycena kentingensis (nom. inval.)]